MYKTQTGFGGSTGLLDLHLEPGAVDNANRRDFGPVAGDTEKRRAVLYENMMEIIGRYDNAKSTEEKEKIRKELNILYIRHTQAYDQDFLKREFSQRTKRDLGQILRTINPPLADAPADAAADAAAADAADEVERRRNGGSRKLKSRRKSSKSVRKNKKYNRRHTKSKKTKRVYK